MKKYFVLIILISFYCNSSGQYHTENKTVDNYNSSVAYAIDNKSSVFYSHTPDDTSQIYKLFKNPPQSYLPTVYWF